MSEPKSKKSSIASDVFSLIGEPIVGSGPTLIGSSGRINFYNLVSAEANRLSKANPEDIQEIAASQIKLLASYYDLVLGQARKSF